MADYNRAKDYIIQRLDTELPDYLYYHNVQHAKSVLSAALLLAKHAEIDIHSTMLLGTAAVYHDAGLIEGMDRHEERGCELVKEILPRFRYSTEEIAEICDLILATNLERGPSTLLESLLCDADLFHLGSDQAELTADNIFKEFIHRGFLRSQKQWVQMQIEFVSQHTYHTHTARWLNDEGKAEYLHSLHRQATVLGLGDQQT